MSFILNLLGIGGKKTVKNADEIKVNKWDSSALKNALDDSAKKWYKEKRKEKLIISNRLIDTRIALTLGGVLVAGFACLYDYLRPFPASYWVIVLCAGMYFVLMTALTAFAWLIECGCIFEALEKDEVGIDPDNRISLTSAMQRYKDTYRLRLTYTDGKSHRRVEEEFSKSVTEYFDEDGVLHVDLFEADLEALHSAAVQRVRGGGESHAHGDEHKKTL